MVVKLRQLGSASPFRLGTIESITGIIAVVRCDDQIVRQVRTDLLFAKGAAPEVGETWVLDNRYGQWMFGAIVGWDGQQSTGATLTGPAGPAGPAGPPGPPGPAGSGASTALFTYTQMSASQLWSITHNLSTFPAVVVVDSAGTEQEGDVSYVDSNHLTIHFSSAFAGTANLIG